MYLTPLIPNYFHIQISQTDLHTFSWRISGENLIKDQCIFRLIIILLIVITCFHNDVLILLWKTDVCYSLKKANSIFFWVFISPRMQGNSLCKCSLKSLKSLSTVFYFLQAKSEFSSTEEIVQTIQTMTANLAKVSNLYPIIHLASTLQKQMVFI